MSDTSHADEGPPAFAVEEQETMHVHKVKPVHGWKEFLNEIMIIVIGVLIALGAEQILENLHWRSKAVEALASVKSEVSSDYIDAVEAAVTGPCVDRQLVALEDALGAPNAMPVMLYSDSPVNSFVVRAPSRNWVDFSWKAAIADGTVPHIETKLKANLETLYYQINDLAVAAREVDVIAWRLRATALPIAASNREHMSETIEEMRGHIGAMTLIANQIMGRADAAGMRPTAEQIAVGLRRSGTVKFCRAHGIALGRPAPEAPS